MVRLSLLRKKKVIVLVSVNILLAIILITTASKSTDFSQITNNLSNIKIDDYIPDSIVGNFFGPATAPKYSRKLIAGSPFQNIATLNTTLNSLMNLDPSAKKQKKTLNNWNKSSLLDQCKILIHSIYYDDNGNKWSNDENISDVQDTKFLSLVSERLRIYNYCFLEGDLDVSEVLEGLEVFEFNQKMFPFLKKPAPENPLLPKILNLKNMQYVKNNIKQSIDDYNKNFWTNWLKFSKGKGFVTTIDMDDSPEYFLKLLTVLHHFGNKLPIQIVVPENTLTENYINLVSKVSNDLNQQVYLITYSDIIATANIQIVDSSIRKFFASLFNLFDEFIMLDTSVVPFISSKDFFKFKEYKESGLYIPRDRTNKEKWSNKFIQSLKALEPTQIEVTMIDTDLPFTTTTGGNNATTNGLLFDLVVKDKIKNISDSSLLIINKRENLFSLIMTTMLGLNQNLQKQFNNNKEFYWIGAHFSGKTYQFESQGAAMMDSPRKLYNENGEYYKTVACDSHIAHVYNNELAWANGGMFKIAHPYDSVNGNLKSDLDTRIYENDSDITERDVESESGENLEISSQNYEPNNSNKFDNELNRINTVKEFEGLLIPDRKFNLWQPDVNEFGETYCSSAIEKDGLEPPHGTVIRFSKRVNEKIKAIAHLWYNTSF